ncbi:hypothetical protein Bhyg_12089 [Pseudolycoriella hygida]|uniref:Uncharacterized protein n=1 Tax=Pseudolycoriella hygida TaxID=35572 RepID=A0A9Q0RYY6_9DIPT|nr:hypothetical protein Bhyg_12089 [Pseudolycoriella hygida]
MPGKKILALLGQVTRSSEIPWCCHFLMVTEAFLGHDVPYPFLNSNDAGYDEFVAVAHGCDYYLCYWSGISNMVYVFFEQ